MSKSLSFRDLLKFPALSGYKELQLALPEMDNTIEPYVYALGIDTREPVEYVANNHRDLSNGTGIGIRVVGEIRRDSAYINSPLCDLIDRIIVAGIKDASLAEEMENLTKQVSNAVAFAEEDIDFADLYEDNYEVAEMEIKSLNNFILTVRGGTNQVKYNVS